MFPLGFLILALGGFLVDSAYKNRAPIKTLEAIISDPKHMRDILNSSAGTGYAPTYSPGVSGSAALPGLMDPNGVLGASATGAAATAWAIGQIGKPYAWGATGPNAFDCSGLVQQAYASVGVKLPRTTFQMLTIGKPVKRSDLQVGDLVFPDPGHVQLYAGNGMIVEAPHTGLKVREVRMWGFMTARRVVAAPAPKPAAPNATIADHNATAFGGNAGLQDIFGGKP